MEETAKAVELVQPILTALLTWVFLAAISIIISGKLISQRLPIGIQDEATFVIPLLIFKIRARGEEVTTGFVAFILSLIVRIFLGGASAYTLFKEQAGVDIGQWNSLCVIASFLSLLVATVICIVVPFFKGTPLINQQDRNETLRILEGRKVDD